MVHMMVPAGQKRATHHAAAGPHGGGRNVGHDHGVGAVLQAGLHERLVLKHVQAALEGGVGLQVVHQRHLVDDRPPCSVHQHRIRLPQRSVGTSQSNPKQGASSGGARLAAEQYSHQMPPRLSNVQLTLYHA